jgi:uncharacterized membrane protein YfcA
MAVGLGPENWALLALCGVFVGLASSLFAIEPGFLLMPLLAILLPRLGVPAGAAALVAIATAIALLVPLSIAGLRPLQRAERRRVAWLSPAILAAAFFGASLVPLMPGPWLLAGFAVTALIALLRPPAAIALTLAVTPPRRPAQPFAAILKSAASSTFGIGLPLSDGAAAEKAALTLMLALAAMAALLNAPPACRGCVGFVFTPALFAIGAAFVLTAPLCRAFLGERLSRSRLRPLAVLAAVSALLAAPITISGTQRTAFAALAPGLCRATAASRFGLQAARYRDPLYLLAQQSSPRRGLAALQAKTPSSSFLAVARDTEAHSPVARTSGWIASIEVRAASAKPRKRTLSSNTHKL